MDFELNESQLMFRTMTRDFAEKEIKPIAMDYDQKADPKEAIPLELYQKGMEQGFHQMIVPTKYGGAGLDAVTTLVILEELAAADAGYATTWHVNNISLTVLLNLGTEDQAGGFIKPIMGPEGGVVSLSTTEPEGGVSSAQMIDPINFVFETKARLEGEYWVVNGSKTYCSNAGLPFAKWVLVFCRSDMNKTGWPSTMPIVIPTNTPGFIVTGEENKMGMRLCNSVSFTLDDARVPRDNGIGAGGRAIVGGSRTVTYEHDSAVASIAIGCARSAYEAAIDWAKERIVLGNPITKYQIIKSKIADMYIGLEAARAFAYRTASYSDTHAEMDLKLARAVKVFATEVATQVASEAVQIFGGAGYSKGTIVEKCYRDIRVTMIYEGTNEAQRISLSQMIEAGM